MDFETRQKSAIAEINEILSKYNLGLNAVLDGYPKAIAPKIVIVDLTEQNKVQENGTETKEKSNNSDNKKAKKSSKKSK
ncbi:MAG TPA: hypothetical protein PKV66_06115 [Candidatus Pelethenecus sp.]|nr:hypothetical protein [Candidatus Pelethenecus sp.]